MRTDSGAVRGSIVVRRALEAELARARARGDRLPRVVDVGGGTGVWAVPFASAGCQVTVVEPNPNALATLQRRAEEEGVSDRLVMVADDSDALRNHVSSDAADLVLAHGLLEVVDDPAALIAALAEVVAPGGTLSILVANRYAAVLQWALAGRLTEARRLLAAQDGVLEGDGETLLRRLDTEQLLALLANSGLEITLLQGDGVISDAVPSGTEESVEAITEWASELAEFEVTSAECPPLRDIASRLHVLARRPE